MPKEAPATAPPPLYIPTQVLNLKGDDNVDQTNDNHHDLASVS